MTKSDLLKALESVPDDCVVVVCKQDPPDDYDNTGEEVVEAGWDHSGSDPGDLGIFYLQVQHEAQGRGPLKRRHLSCYYEPQYGDMPFCVDIDEADDEYGRVPSEECMRFTTPKEAGEFVASWLKIHSRK